MFKALFNIIINILATLIQIVCLPINAVISAALPNLSNTITQVISSINTAFAGMGWALSILPSAVIAALTFILGCEIAKHTIYISTYALIKVFNVLQKLKLW